MRVNETNAFLSLAKDVSADRLGCIVGYGAGVQTSLGRWNGQTHYAGLSGALPLNLTAPNLDFGHLLDRHHNHFIGSDAYDSLLDDGLQSLQSGSLLVPHPQCAYLFHCVEDSDDYERAYCVSLEEVGGTVIGHQFVRQNAPASTGLDRWIMDCVSFEFLGGQDVLLRYSIPKPLRPPLAIETLTNQAQITVCDVIVATMLLASPLKLASEQPSPNFRVDKYNRSRKLGQAKLASPTMVRLDRAVPLPAAKPSPSSSGAPKSGHYRRAHVRVLWRGTEKEREVTVQAAQVKGGKPMQRYTIAPANHPAPLD